MRRNPSRRPFPFASVLGALALVAASALPTFAAENAVIIPPPALDAKSSGKLETAVLAGGCFWGVQGVFQHTSGVVNAVSGYAGGSKISANYSMVSTGVTDHAEAVEIKYDPAKISYGKILQIYFSVAHDPTLVNRQGPDTGTQYRSEIFAANDEQRAVADAYIKQLNAAKVYPAPIATKTGSLKAFYPAEAYHQDYLTLNPRQPYIAINDLPKVENLKKVFSENYRSTPVLVSQAKITN